jgi:hemerythrin-like domain-containing protein
MNVTDILVREHLIIRESLDALSRARDDLEQGQRPPKEFFAVAVEFARNFADKYHHFKEEYLMFGLLAQKKAGLFDGPIGSLRHEHEQCRYFIEKIFESIDSYAGGDEIATTTLLENLAAYISILKKHIHIEDHVFFKMAEQELSEKEKRILVAQFEKEEHKLGGTKFVETCRTLVLEMGSLIGEQP